MSNPKDAEKDPEIHSPSALIRPNLGMEPVQQRSRLSGFSKLVIQQTLHQDQEQGQLQTMLRNHSNKQQTSQSYQSFSFNNHLALKQQSSYFGTHGKNPPQISQNDSARFGEMQISQRAPAYAPTLVVPLSQQEKSSPIKEALETNLLRPSISVHENVQAKIGHVTFGRDPKSLKLQTGISEQRPKGLQIFEEKSISMIRATGKLGQNLDNNQLRVIKKQNSFNSYLNFKGQSQSRSVSIRSSSNNAKPPFYNIGAINKLGGGLNLDPPGIRKGNLQFQDSIAEFKINQLQERVHHQIENDNRIRDPNNTDIDNFVKKLIDAYQLQQASRPRAYQGEAVQLGAVPIGRLPPHLHFGQGENLEQKIERIVNQVMHKKQQMHSNVLGSDPSRESKSSNMDKLYHDIERLVNEKMTLPKFKNPTSNSKSKSSQELPNHFAQVKLLRPIQNQNKGIDNLLDESSARSKSAGLQFKINIPADRVPGVQINMDISQINQEISRQEKQSSSHLSITRQSNSSPQFLGQHNSTSQKQESFGLQVRPTQQLGDKRMRRDLLSSGSDEDREFEEPDRAQRGKKETNLDSGDHDHDRAPRKRGKGKKQLLKQNALKEEMKKVVLKHKETDEEKAVVCKCNQSKCLKMYCLCFTRGLFCNDDCNCRGCHNLEDMQAEIRDARRLIKTRDRNAFESKIRHYEKDDPTESKKQKKDLQQAQETAAQAVHISGCNCKNSQCQKNYCECFKAGIGCDPKKCKCVSCKNILEES